MIEIDESMEFYALKQQAHLYAEGHDPGQPQPAKDSWDMLARGMKRMVEGRGEMVRATTKAVGLAAAMLPKAKHNPTPRGPAGKALSSRQMRRAMGENNRHAKPSLVGDRMFDGTVVLVAGTRAIKRISGARKRTR